MGGPTMNEKPSDARERTSHARTGLRRCIATRIGAGLYGFNVDEVQEVIAMRSLSRVFHAPRALAGLTSLRGEVLPILDPAVLLGETVSHTDTQGAIGASETGARIVVVREAAGARRRAGLLVDQLSGLRDLLEEGLVAAPNTLPEEVRELLVGVISSAPPCAVLSVTALLDSKALAFQ
jgi:purine-binding chemotaxis protein CheW